MNMDIAHWSLASLTTLHWLRPQWLWLLLALPLLAWWHGRQRQRSIWNEVVDAHLLTHLLEEGSRTRGVRWLALLGIAIAICALAGPSWQRAHLPWRHHRPSWLRSERAPARRR